MPKLTETSWLQYTGGAPRFTTHPATGGSAQVVDSAPDATVAAFPAIAFFATTLRITTFFATVLSGSTQLQEASRARVKSSISLVRSAFETAAADNQVPSTPPRILVREK